MDDGTILSSNNCSSTSPSTRMRLSRSNNMSARWGHSTIPTSPASLSSSLFCLWLKRLFWRTFIPEFAITCLAFMLAHGWNCKVTQPVVLFVWRIAVVIYLSLWFICIVSTVISYFLAILYLPRPWVLSKIYVFIIR